MLKRSSVRVLISLLISIACLSFGGNALAQHKDKDKLRDDDRLTKDDNDQTRDRDEDRDDDNDNRGRRSRTFGPFRSTSTDGGSCGTTWAVDMFDRFFKVTNNGNGTFRVREEFRRGTFVTTGPASPGACETSSPHGSLVNAGVVGRFFGFLDGTVTSTTYNPNGCATPGACTTTAGFLLATFGPSGSTFTCSTGYAGCKFDFNYFAVDQGLLYHHWEDRGLNGVTEDFFGDIANF